jgi:acylphosphatase
MASRRGGAQAASRCANAQAIDRRLLDTFVAAVTGRSKPRWKLQPMMQLEIRWKGQVQGVGFRATVCKLAQEHGLTGWVRNEPDGSVLAIVEGLREAIVAWQSDVRVARESAIRESKESWKEFQGKWSDFAIH